LDESDTRQLLCLEIASGAAKWHEAKWIKSDGISSNNDSDVLMPGSLRERGEFCLVELGLVEDTLEAVSDSGKQHATFRWKVVNVDVHRLNQVVE
jgi:hypothetical protein